MPNVSIECIACGSVMAEKYSSMFDDRYGYPGYFSLYQCPACSQLQTVPLLREAEIPALYRDYYPRREIDTAALERSVGDPGSPAARYRRWVSGTDNQGQY